MCQIGKCDGTTVWGLHTALANFGAKVIAVRVLDAARGRKRSRSTLDGTGVASSQRRRDGGG